MNALTPSAEALGIGYQERGGPREGALLQDRSTVASAGSRRTNSNVDASAGEGGAGAKTIVVEYDQRQARQCTSTAHPSSVCTNDVSTTATAVQSTAASTVHAKSRDPRRNVTRPPSKPLGWSLTTRASRRGVDPGTPSG